MAERGPGERHDSDRKAADVELGPWTRYSATCRSSCLSLLGSMQRASARFIPERGEDSAMQAERPVKDAEQMP